MPAAKRDYYEILGLAKNASAAEIKSAYRRLAMRYHPDRVADADKADAEHRFKEATEAYEVLSDEQKRARYDQFGHQGVAGQTHDYSHMDMGDIFSAFEEMFSGMGFGGFGGRRGGGRTRGYDLETQVELTLEDVSRGVERTIEFDRQDHCEVCKGSGAKPGSAPTACPTCGGQGRVAQAGFGGMLRMVTTCPSCRGRGQVIKDRCGACDGSGRTMVKRKITVRIPAGVQEGQAVRVAGEGEPGDPGMPPGDLHVHIVVKPHPMFARHGNDLVCQVPIGFTQAALGAAVDVPTLDGKERLEIPAGTQHGEIFKIRGKGLPDIRGVRRGDLVLQVTIEIPKKLTERQRELLNEFASTEDPSHTPQRKSFLDKVKSIFNE